MRSNSIGIAILAAALLGATAAPAQMMGPGTGMGSGMGFFSNGLGRSAAFGRAMDMSAIADAWLAGLHAQLALAPEQETAWQAFAAAVKAQAASMQALRTQMWQGSGTAPQRAAFAEQLMLQRAQAMGATADALDALYAQLSPQQRAILDQAFPMGFGPGGPFGG